MSGFDRIKPPAKRLSDRDESRQPDSEVADNAGRAALFSASGVTSAPPSPTPPPTPPPSPPTPAEPAADPTTDPVTPRRRPDVRIAQGPPEGAAPPSEPPVEEPVTSTEPPSQADGKTLPSGKSLLQVECGHCGITCPMPLGVAVKRAFPLAVLVPMKSHPVFATCPCGERRTWLKPTLGLPK